MIQITSINHLKELAFRDNGDFVEFYIYLAKGIARSCKRISYRPDEKKQWLIINEIDNSYQELQENTLSTRTNIILALNNGALFLSNLP
jgi:hypothetical protein